MIVLNFKRFDVWHSNNYVWISTILLVLCFNVSKSSWNWKSSWKHSM